MGTKKPSSGQPGQDEGDDNADRLATIQADARISHPSLGGEAEPTGPDEFDSTGILTEGITYVRAFPIYFGSVAVIGHGTQHPSQWRNRPRISRGSLTLNQLLALAGQCPVEGLRKELEKSFASPTKLSSQSACKPIARGKSCLFESCLSLCWNR